MSVAQRERAALVQTMRETGPDHPTLCGEWTNRELAAHLVVRERRLDAAPGIMIPALADYTERVTRQVAAETDWTELLDRVASGPPVFSPFKLLDPVVNVAEMFIHHEDVRRGQPGWRPRELSPQDTAELTRSVKSGLSRLMLRKAGSGIEARMPGEEPVVLRKGEPVVTITGDPGEIVLWLSGRDAVDLEFGGDPAAVDGLRALQRGF